MASRSVEASTPTPLLPSDIITVEELASRLQCSLHWVYSQMRPKRSNPLPVMRVGGRMLRFSWAAVCIWMQGQAQPTGKKRLARA